MLIFFVLLLQIIFLTLRSHAKLCIELKSFCVFLYKVVHIFGKYKGELSEKEKESEKAFVQIWRKMYVME